MQHNTKTVFSGKFEPNCQEDSVPISLLYLVENILTGASIQFSERHTKNTHPNSTASLSISQLLFFNCKGRRSTIDTSISRHSKDREPPLPVYLGVMLHAKTRKQNLIDMLYNLGMCVSYDWVMSISTDLGNQLCKHYKAIDTDCLPTLSKILLL